MSKTFFSLTFTALLVGATSGLSAAEAIVATDPEHAGPDFPIQGEYAGEGSAAQVIALAEGKFHVVTWNDGLPGTSPKAEKKREFDAATEAGKVTFKSDGWQGQIVGGELIIKDDKGKLTKGKRVVRESPTLNAKPPRDAVVLFDGTDVNAWSGAKILPGGLLQMGAKTKAGYQDFTLHIEFRLPFKPLARGQERGNSGIYLQDRYEVQVLDSFGLSGENNECGGIYEISKPRVNMCFPPLQWQTYDIDFTAAKFDANRKKTANAIVTVRHNGVMVQERLEIPRATTASGTKEGPEPAPISLQNHGNPVVYRNIWIIEKKK